MRYLIFGVNGMAGHVIAKYLEEKGHEVTGFARQQSPFCKTIIGDARNWSDVEKALKTEKYDVVVNCIGVLNKRVDASLANGIYLNSTLPHLLAEELRDRSAKLIHISSDCVFEGTRGQYTEKDRPDAISYYGRSKALGEVVDQENLTLRTSIVGPELKADGVGLFHWFMKQKDTVAGYKNVIWSGVTTLQLAKSIEEDIVRQKTGLYHLVNNRPICKHDLLQLFNLEFRKNPIEITENDTVISDRSLICTDEGQRFSVPDYQPMLVELAEWMDNHRALYGQYAFRSLKRSVSDEIS